MKAVLFVEYEQGSDFMKDVKTRLFEKVDGATIYCISCHEPDVEKLYEIISQDD